MLTFLLTLALMLMLLLLSDGAASNARILEYKGCPIPIAANATNATIATIATISCRLPHSSVQHYGRIQGPDQSQREGERERVPPSWQECNIHCHLADNGSGQVGQFVAP